MASAPSQKLFGMEANSESDDEELADIGKPRCDFLNSVSPSHTTHREDIKYTMEDSDDSDAKPAPVAAVQFVKRAIKPRGNTKRTKLD